MSKLEKLIQQYCPDGVEYVPLSSIGTIKRGNGLQKKDFVKTGIGCIHYGQIYTRFGLFTNKALTYVDKKLADHLLHIEKGDLVIACTSENIEDVCKAVAWLGDDSIVTGGHSCVLHHNQNPKYIAYFFQTESFQRQKRKYAYGTKVIDIKPDSIGKIEIPVPPLPVQEEIVRVLDTFTELQAELQAELQKRKQQYNFYRDNLLNFKDINRGGQEIKWMKMSEIGNNLDKKRKPITAGKRESGQIPYYGASGIVDYVKDYLFDGDYLLVSEDGANLLTRTYPIAFSIHGKTWVNNHAHVIEFKERATRKYVEYYLNSIDLSPWISAGAQPKLTQDSLNKLTIPVPPLAEQQKIVSILDRFDTLTTDLTQGLPAEIEKRRQQYEFYRDKLLTFKRKEA